MLVPNSNVLCLALSQNDDRLLPVKEAAIANFAIFIHLFLLFPE